MPAPIGATVKLYYDGRKLEPGDFLRTPSDRLYLVISIRVQARGRHVGRQHLLCSVASSPRPGARVVPLFWYRRRRRSR